ncbi:hypothetical protein [Mycolicibacterium cosmeticum]|uniref:hypothetical protein n=1 Tax=Mycolicibacterium cosmeticum TaxID=258533 RepID=UPI003204D32C
MVSRETADAICGIVIDDAGGLVLTATADRRAGLRAASLPDPQSGKYESHISEGQLIDDNLAVTVAESEQVVSCVHCGRTHGRVGDDIRQVALSSQRNTESGMTARQRRPVGLHRQKEP